MDWWNVRNGLGTVSTVAGQTDYGDFGLLSSGGCTADGTVCQPPLNTPFAPYHALALLDTFADPGDQLLRVSTGDPLVRGHAVRRANGELAVLLLNQDPDREHRVAVSYPGYTPSPNAPKVTTYLNGGTGLVHSRTGTAGEQTLPPYSLTMYVLKPKFSRTLPPTPGTPAVSAVSDTAATVTWQPVPRSVRNAGYDVYVQDAAGFRLAGHTDGTSISLTGLSAATRYAVTVLARDVAGAEFVVDAGGVVRDRYPRDEYLRRQGDQHVRLGQRVRRQRRHHQHRQRTGRRLDARVQLPPPVAVLRRRLERELDRGGDERQRIQCGLERLDRPRGHDQRRVRRQLRRPEPAARAVHAERHGLHDALVVRR